MKMLVRKPPGNGPFPTVVFVHGLGMSLHEWNNSFDEIAQKLNTIGILTVQFQFPIFINGKTIELPLMKRAAVLEEVLHRVQRRKYVDRIGVLAQSYGVPTALCADLSFVKTFVSISGVFFVKESIEKVYGERGVKINYQGDTTLPRSSGENTTVTKEFWQDLLSFDPIKKVKNVTLPVLLLHGDKDTKVSIQEVKTIFQAIQGEKKLKIFEGGDHGIVDVPRPMREQFLNDVVDWFLKIL